MRGALGGAVLILAMIGAGAWEKAQAGEQSTEELLKERKCSADADCLKKQEAGTLRKDRSYICLATYCQLGCRDHAACIRATGNNLARCVSQNCYIPAWMVP